MLQNAYFLAKIGADTAENEQHFAEILPIGRRVADRYRHGLGGAEKMPAIALPHRAGPRWSLWQKLGRGNLRADPRSELRETDVQAPI